MNTLYPHWIARSLLKLSYDLLLVGSMCRKKHLHSYSIDRLSIEAFICLALLNEFNHAQSFIYHFAIITCSHVLIRLSESLIKFLEICSKHTPHSGPYYLPTFG
jgi:hypothetical protein